MRPKEARPSFCWVRTKATLLGAGRGGEEGEGEGGMAVVVVVLSSLPADAAAAVEREVVRHVVRGGVAAAAEKGLEAAVGVRGA